MATELGAFKRVGKPAVPSGGPLPCMGVTLNLPRRRKLSGLFFSLSFPFERLARNSFSLPTLGTGKQEAELGTFFRANAEIRCATNAMNST
jgi:hypothetical protein